MLDHFSETGTLPMPQVPTPDPFPDPTPDPTASESSSKHNYNQIFRNTQNREWI